MLSQRKYTAPSKTVGNSFLFIGSIINLLWKYVNWSKESSTGEKKKGFVVEKEAESKAVFRMTQSPCSPSWQGENNSSSLIETTLIFLWPVLVSGYKPRLGLRAVERIDPFPVIHTSLLPVTRKRRCPASWETEVCTQESTNSTVFDSSRWR